MAAAPMGQRRMVYNKVVDSPEDPAHYKVFEDTWSRKLANHGIPDADKKLIKEQWSLGATDYYIKDQKAEHTQLCIIDGASPVLAIPQSQEDRLMDEAQARFESKKVKGVKKEVDVVNISKAVRSDGRMFHVQEQARVLDPAQSQLVQEIQNMSVRSRQVKTVMRGIRYMEAKEWTAVAGTLHFGLWEASSKALGHAGKHSRCSILYHEDPV